MRETSNKDRVEDLKKDRANLSASMDQVYSIFEHFTAKHGPSYPMHLEKIIEESRPAKKPAEEMTLQEKDLTRILGVAKLGVLYCVHRMAGETLKRMVPAPAVTIRLPEMGEMEFPDVAAAIAFLEGKR